jgi:hypothetical protein
LREGKGLTVAGTSLETGSTLREEVASYVAGIMRRFADRPERAGGDADPLAEELFRVLTARRFCYLGRRRTRPYRDQVVRTFDGSIQRGEPVSLFYDIGPGYHAALRPGEQDLSFDVGFSEVLLLSQVASFSNRVAALYPPGAHFWLVIDNLCGLWTNGIPLERTEGYCARLRSLIRAVGLEARVELLVESEQFGLGEYDRLFSALEPCPPASTPSDGDVENVERFLGRRCDAAEAAERIDRYRRATIVTETLLPRLVRGVRMTQRASATTLGFRPFPGGDARTQCGEVAISRNSKGRLHPVLLTSKNVDYYERMHFRFPEQLPSPVPGVTFAARLSSARSLRCPDEADQVKYEYRPSAW